MIRVNNVIWFAGNDTRDAQNSVQVFFYPLISGLLSLVPLIKIAGNFRFENQIGWNFNFKQDEAPVERFLAPSVDQSFQDAQRD